MTDPSSSSSSHSTGTNTSYRLTPLAYALPILHSALHPSSTTIGVFLSSISSPSISTAKEITIDTAVPLIHLYTSLSPMLEAGLSLAHEHASSNNQRIVGLYIAHSAEEKRLGRVGERILSSLREKYDGAFAFVIDNDRLAAGQPAYIPYLPFGLITPSTPLKPLTSPTADELPQPFGLPSRPNLANDVMNWIRKEKVHRYVRDFDDHLEDSSQDFLDNKNAVNSLRKYLA